MLPPLRYSLFVLLLLAFGAGHLNSQILYYSNTFNGGTTAGGWGPSLGGSGTGNFEILISPGSTVLQAYLIASGHGPNNNFTVQLNGTDITITSADEASAFPDPTYGGNCIVSIVDVTSLIDPAVNDYTITAPFQDSNNGFENYMLYVAYQNDALPQVSTYIYLNDQAMAPTPVTWTLTGMQPYPNSGNIAVSLLFDYCCSVDSDGEYVQVNGSYIGNCGGIDYNSGSCATILGNYAYENGVTTGLNNDTADNSIYAGDALFNAESFVTPGNTGMDMIIYDGPDLAGYDNGFYVAIFTYGSSCDIPPYTVSDDVSICPGQSTQLEATGADTYSWSPAQDLDDPTAPDPVATPSATTTYEVEMLFANGCTLTQTVTVTVDQNSLTFNTEILNPVCSGNGEITVTNILGATGSVTYELDGAFETDSVFADLPPGFYDVVLTDEEGCTGSDIVEIVLEVVDLIIDSEIENPLCTGNGNIEIVNVSNASGNVVYFLDGTAEPDNIFDELPPGNYLVEVVDELGCTGADILEVELIVYEIEFSADITDQLCETNGNIEIIAIENGEAPYGYSLNGIADDDGYFPDLPGGNYDITITDTLGCSGSQSLQVNVQNPTVTFEGVIINAVCEIDGIVDLINISGTGPYNLIVDGEPETDLLVDSLAEGTHSFEISDMNGCTGSEEFEVGYEDPSEAVFGISTSAGQIPLNVDFYNQSIGLDVFTWIFEAGDSAYTFDASHTFELPGDYEVTLIGYDTVYGCRDTTSMVISADIYALFVPNAFSPDGDGINEVFIPSGNGLDPDHYLFQVYNRWGDVIFETTDLTKAWTGNVHDNAHFAQIGTYIYQVTYRFVHQIEDQTLLGHVMLFR